jgi:hypothetical protein
VILRIADVTHAGLVSTTTQTFAGLKTFLDRTFVDDELIVADGRALSWGPGSFTTVWISGNGTDPSRFLVFVASPLRLYLTPDNASYDFGHIGFTYPKIRLGRDLGSGLVWIDGQSVTLNPAAVASLTFTSGILTAYTLDGAGVGSIDGGTWS